MTHPDDFNRTFDCLPMILSIKKISFLLVEVCQAHDFFDFLFGAHESQSGFETWFTAFFYRGKTIDLKDSL
jgi:hypothetical protein